MGFAEKKLAVVLALLQTAFIVLFALFAEYHPAAHPAQAPGAQDSLHPTYAMFQDVHIMIFVGFGFLMTFLKRYGYSAVGYNFLLATLSLQWAILVQGLIRHGGVGFHVDIVNLVEGDFGAAAVLITMGALLGKTSPLQLVVVALIEIVFYSLNFWIGNDLLKAVDAGGSMFIHTFGAYFGLGASLLLRAKWHKDSESNASQYHSDLFAMIGTLFLWVAWPSFNAALIPAGEQQHRAIVNSYFSLACSVTGAFLASIFANKNHKLDIVHVQNATLAGGVAIGTCANLLVNPFGAMIIGTTAGILSVIGYRWLTPCLAEKLRIHDTCGVHNLHGLPGIFAGLCGVVAAALADPRLYGPGLSRTFPEVKLSLSRPDPTGPPVFAGWEGRSPMAQAAMQAAALAVTLAIAIGGGVISGFVLKLGIWEKLLENEGFEDEPYWELPQVATGEAHDDLVSKDQPQQQSV